MLALPFMSRLSPAGGLLSSFFSPRPVGSEAKITPFLELRGHLLAAAVLTVWVLCNCAPKAAGTRPRYIDVGYRYDPV